MNGEGVNVVSLDLSHLKKGIYITKIKNLTSNSIHYQKIIKK